jgi:hypothetical protein
MKLTDCVEVDDFLIIHDTIPIISKTIGVRVYDFNFRHYFPTQSLLSPPTKMVVARIGAFPDYSVAYDSLLSAGIKLVHTLEQYQRCSLLPHWYPLILDLTPKSKVYESFPTVKEIENEFSWPVFVKGERQTSRHKKSLSIIENAAAFEDLRIHWKQNTMLHWQKMVCREYIPLQLVEPSSGDRLPSSYEFRLFYWGQQLVSIGRYWYDASPYELSRQEKAQVEALGNEVAKRLSVCFLAVDIAKTVAGKWIVIEVNDGQESGYAANNPRLMWEQIIAIEKLADN